MAGKVGLNDLKAGSLIVEKLTWPLTFNSIELKEGFSFKEFLYLKGKKSGISIKTIIIYTGIPLSSQIYSFLSDSGARNSFKIILSGDPNSVF